MELFFGIGFTAFVMVVATAGYGLYTAFCERFSASGIAAARRDEPFRW